MGEGARRRIFINGKFYAGGMNGVHRVADRLVRELDGLLEAHPELDVTLLLPAKCAAPPALKRIGVAVESRGHSQLWEQAILPFRARGGLLVNLCNFAPLLHGRKILMIHDAQFLFPDSSYPLRQRLWHRFVTPWAAYTSRAVLTVSDYSRQMLDLMRVARRERTLVVHNGVDHLANVAPAPPAGLVDDGVPFVAHFASAKAYKNTAILLEAFRLPELSDIRLLLIGPSREKLGALAAGAPPNVVFAGGVDDAVLRALYEKALCLAMPSRTEGFGLPPLEAMASGCPAVIAPAGAMPEICRDAALYADVDDARSWAAAIRALADDPALRARKIAEGAARAAAFTWAAAGRRLLDVILLESKT